MTAPRLRHPLVLFALAIAAGLASVGDATAELILRDLDVVLEGDGLRIDLNQDGVPDFDVFDNVGEGSSITVVNGDASIFVDPNDPVASPRVLGPGDRVDGESGFRTPFAVQLWSRLGGVFEQAGDTGFLALALGGPSSGESTFGFLEITRGSTIVGQIGYQTTPGVAAVIPIPEPAGLAIASIALAAAAAGRRRRA